MEGEKIRKSSDYDKFKRLLGNRDINQAHIVRIKQSVEEKGYLFNIIIVNEKMEIIDGQHRFEVFKELGLPIFYVVKRGYGLEQVHIYNQNAKNWTLTQFMESYAGMGRPNYEVYKFFKEKYGFGHKETMSILGGYNGLIGGVDVDVFKDGLWKVKDLDAAENMAKKIYDFAPYYDGFRRRSFVVAIIKINKTVEDYNHRQMIKRVKYQSAKLQDQINTSGYVRVLEGIYNYNSRGKRIRFE